MDGWSEFNVAMMGATAALAGLLIVAASVNIGEIIKSPAISSRLAAGLAGLVLAIVASGIGLVPGLPLAAYATATVLLALVAALISVMATRRIYQNRDPANRAKVVKSVVGFITPGCYLVGGILVVAGLPIGLMWFAAGALAAIVAGILISWVALVEVLR